MTEKKDPRRFLWKAGGPGYFLVLRMFSAAIEDCCKKSAGYRKDCQKDAHAGFVSRTGGL